MNQKILESVIRIIKIYSNDNNAVNELTPINLIKIDSLDFLEFQMNIDEQFNIEIPIEEFLKCETIGDVVDLIEEYVK